MTINDCDMCRWAPSTFNCSIHTLNYGVVRELNKDMLRGNSWGNIIYYAEQELIACETAEQKVERLMKIDKQDEQTADNLKEYQLKKLASLNINTKTGDLKRKVGRCCRDAEESAKWVVGKRKLGNYKEWIATDPKTTKKPSVRPAGVPANAIFWSYGCEPHAKGCCPHLHPGEAGYEEAKSGKRFVVAEALMARATYISNKPIAKPSPLNNQVYIPRDAWDIQN